MFDYIVVGAGFSGAVIAERIASQLKKRVLIIERRNHIGGNCYDYYNQDGILVHKYGPHIFHTRLIEVWDYLSKFTEWNLYQHQVLGSIDGSLIPIPFNLNSLEQLFSPTIAEKLANKLIETYGYGSKVGILKLRETSDAELKLLADYIYERIYSGYTQKQWGVKPEDLDQYVTGRAPIFISRDNRHFQAEFQGIPRYGYSQLFTNMLAHPNIKLMLNTDYGELLTINHHTRQIKFMGQPFEGKLIFTGQIDELFDYCFGDLPYRSMDFEYITLNQERYQAVATINYPNDYDFTRISEMKYLTGQKHQSTTIIKEYPKACGRKDIPYYPIPRAANLELFKKYKELAKDYPNIILSGRLADYKYYDMHIAVYMAMEKFKNELAV